MFYFLGTSFPANSVGVLPHRVLNVDVKSKALGLLHNAKQIKEQYDAHENRIKKSTFKFTEFEDIQRYKGNFFLRFMTNSG